MALVPFPGTQPSPYQFPSDDDDDSPGAKMSFLEHLDELRKRIVHAAIAVLVGILISFSFISRIYSFLIAPVFQMPTIVFFLAKMNLITARFLIQQFKYAVLLTFIISAVITPTGDPVTQTVFAAPMIGLYVLGIGIAWLVGPKRPSE